MEKPESVYFPNGLLYDGFRPQYPEILMQDVIERVQAFNHYLDVATGTGQLLFPYAPKFENSIGTDISESQIQQAREKSEELKNTSLKGKSIKFLCGDCGKLDQFLANSNIDTKFDLITFGEAFHWFDMNYILEVCKTKLLSKDGILAILSYSIGGIEIKEDEALTAESREAYNEFYDTVKGESKFSQEVLLSGYKDIPFENYFSKVSRRSLLVKVPIELDWILGHFRTWSMYNLYLKKHSQDPLEKLSARLTKVLSLAKEKNSIEQQEKPFIFVIPFFEIICENK